MLATPPRGFLTELEEPTYCYTCEADVEPGHYAKRVLSRARFGHRWTCRVIVRGYNNAYYRKLQTEEERLAKRRVLDSARYQRDLYKRRYYGCLSSDRRRGLQWSSWEEVAHLFDQPCYYCGDEAGGVDRINSDLGHTVDNLVPCCFRCNTVLGDLPPGAKNLLREGLAEIGRSGAWADWIPPTLRNQNRKGQK